MHTPGADSFEVHVLAYLRELEVRSYSKAKIGTTRAVLAFLTSFLQGLGVETAHGVRESHLASFARALEAKRSRGPFTVGTQRAYLSTVRGFFSFLEERGVLLHNPAAELALPRVQRLPRGVLSEAQARRLMAAPSAWTALGLRDRALLEVFYGTGLRLSECLNLTLSDVDLAERLLLVRRGKGGKDRVVPIPGRAALALDRYLREGRGWLARAPRVDVVFLSCRGRRLTQSAVSSNIHAYGREAKIPWKVSPHILRHTFATHLIQGGADVRHVQQLLGHADLETTAIYTRVAVKDLKDAVGKAHPRERFRLPK